MAFVFQAAPCRGGKFRTVMTTSGNEIATYHKRDIERGGHAGKRWRLRQDGRTVWRFAPGSCRR